LLPSVPGHRVKLPGTADTALVIAAAGALASGLPYVSFHRDKKSGFREIHGSHRNG
jgi:hypothetical protein